MKILMVAMTFNVDNILPHMVSLCHTLQQEGHEISLISSDNTPPQSLVEMGIHHDNIPMNRRVFALLPPKYSLLRDIISRQSPDIIHAWDKHTAMCCGKLKKELGFALVSTAQRVAPPAVSDCLTLYSDAQRPMRQLLVSGYYGFLNAGDDAILHAIQQNIGKKSDIHITVLSNNPASTTEQYGLDALPRFHLPTVIRAIRSCDVLLSGGGSLLQDSTSTRSILYYLLLIRIARFFRKSVMVYANGIGPVTRPLNRFLTKRILSKVDIITVRDQNSYDELRSIGVKNPNIHRTADPVFTLRPADSLRGTELLQTTDMTPKTPFVAVSVRSWSDTDALPAQLALLCDHLYHTHHLSVLFLLMQPSHDLEMSLAVQAKMTCPSHILTATTTPQELMAILGESTLCLAMRLHTIIFSACMSVPILGIDYDPKVASYLQELSMPSAGRAVDFSGDKAIFVADRLMGEYDNYKSTLAEKTATLTAAAQKNDSLLLALLRRK